MTSNLRWISWNQHQAGRGLLWIVGTPDISKLCMDCRDHPARVRVMRLSNRDGVYVDMKSHVLLHLCETCTTSFVEQPVEQPDGYVSQGFRRKVAA